MAAPLPPQHTLEFQGFLFLRPCLEILQAFRKLLRASWQAFSSASPAAAGLEKLLRLPWTLLGLPLRTFRGLWVGRRAALWLSELPRGSGSAEVRVFGFLGRLLSFFKNSAGLFRGVLGFS